MDRARLKTLIAGDIVLVGFILSLFMLGSLWALDENGLSQLNHKLPIWDFSNLWAAGVLVLDGKTHVLFEPEAYRAALRALYTPLLTDQEWSYPPSMLLLAVPLALLPVLPAYGVWTLGTLVLLHLALKPLHLPRYAHVVALLSPGVVMNVVVGQNGAFTAALLLGGLLLAPRRPILAGILFGLLTMKPHLGLLIPLCLLASRNWKAIGSAVVTTLLLVGVTALFFGPSVWISFRTVTAPLMAAILEAPYPQSYHTLALTAFSAGRSLGWGLPASYLLQAVVSLAAMASALGLWLPGAAPVSHEKRVVLTGLLALLATPYGYVYDSVPFSVAVAFLFLEEKRIPLAVHGLAWLFPLFVPALALRGFGAGIVVVIGYTALHLGLVLRDRFAVPRQA